VSKGLEGRGRKTIMGPSLNSQSEFTFRLSLRFCFWSLHSAQTPGLYPVWSFATAKTPEENPRRGLTTGTPDTPEFFAEQKMRPNEVLKNILYLLILFK
jgi:hypothetical protein